MFAGDEPLCHAHQRKVVFVFFAIVACFAAVSGGGQCCVVGSGAARVVGGAYLAS